MSKESPTPSPQTGNYFDTYRTKGIGEVMPADKKPAKVPVLGQQHFDTMSVPPASDVTTSTPTQEDPYHKTYREEGLGKLIEHIDVDPGVRTKRDQEAS